MEAKVLTPLRAIRQKCLDCSGGSVTEVDRCVIKDCPLYPYRKGKNPNRTPRVLTDEQRDMLRERLLKAREKQRS